MALKRLDKVFLIPDVVSGGVPVHWSARDNDSPGLHQSFIYSASLPLTHRKILVDVLDEISEGKHYEALQEIKGIGPTYADRLIKAYVELGVVYADFAVYTPGVYGQKPKPGEWIKDIDEYLVQPRLKDLEAPSFSDFRDAMWVIQQCLEKFEGTDREMAEQYIASSFEVGYTLTKTKETVDRIKGGIREQIHNAYEYREGMQGPPLVWF